jgi:hypothetical protein
MRDIKFLRNRVPIVCVCPNCSIVGKETAAINRRMFESGLACKLLGCHLQLGLSVGPPPLSGPIVLLAEVIRESDFRLALRPFSPSTRHWRDRPGGRGKDEFRTRES